ncbi:hypothetical protein KJ567_04740 [Candidatus Bipolaricaulota bacterium]|nr:hypothetical protein [Candidatus Bipolaricaulota bacterium]
MTRRTIFAAALFVLLCAPVALSVEWSEFQAFPAVTTDPVTGAPSLIFSLGLAYDERPSAMRIRTSWEVYVVENGERVLLESYARTSPEMRGAGNVYAASPRVTIEAGGRYLATVVIEDLVNDLTHEHVFDFLAPLSLPLGIHFEGSDGSEALDLTGLPDEELEELVLLYRLLVADYELTAEGVELSAMLSDHSGLEESYPMAALLIPSNGLSSEIGPEDAPITVTVAQVLYVYSIPSSEGVDGFEGQVEDFGRDFVGMVYAGPGGDGLGAGKIVFIHEPAWLVLEAAAAEYARRTE